MKNTVEVINVERYTLVPNVSFGIFKIGAPIEDYTWEYDYTYFRIDENQLYNYYEFKGFRNINVYVNDLNRIESIIIDKYCFYRGINLIGYNYNKFKELINIEPDEEHIEFLIVDDKPQNQHVYEFDNWGLQVWVRYGIIKCIICNNYSISLSFNTCL